MHLVIIAVICIALSIGVHLCFAKLFGGIHYFQKDVLLQNMRTTGLLFTALSEGGSVLFEWAVTGNLYGALSSRTIAFIATIPLAGFLVCYLQWFADKKNQIWDLKIENKILHKYVESTLCCLLVWGTMSSFKLTAMYGFGIISIDQAWIMFGTSLGMIVLGVGNLLMQLTLLWRKKKTPSVST